MTTSENKPTSRPSVKNYDMSNHDDLRRFSEDWEKYADSFFQNLIKKDLDNGIPLEACREAWETALSIGQVFSESERLYRILIPIAYKALGKH